MLRGDEVGIFRAIPVHEMRAVLVRLPAALEQEETGAVLVRVTALRRVSSASATTRRGRRRLE